MVYSSSVMRADVTGGQVTVNGVRLVYDVHGAGAMTVVLAGPIGAPGAAWVPFQVPALVAAGYRVVTFNPRGVPPSEVPAPPYSVAEMAADLAGLIEHVASHPVALIGYSMGALVAQEVALARAELLRGLLLLGTLGRKDAMRRALFDASAETLRSGQRLPRCMEVVHQALHLFGPTRLDDDRWIQGYLDWALAAPDPSPDSRAGLLGQQEATTAYDDRLNALRAVSVPTLVIGFELDVLVPAKLTREVAKAITGSRYVEIPAAGHGGPWEHPDPVNHAIVEFLAHL
jgi:pimeloyl-ACP methyl ester carboxylesterase